MQPGRLCREQNPSKSSNVQNGVVQPGANQALSKGLVLLMHRHPFLRPIVRVNAF